MSSDKLADEDWELRFFFRAGSSISIDLWERFKTCKFLVRLPASPLLVGA